MKVNEKKIEKRQLFYVLRDNEYKKSSFGQEK